MTEMKIQVPGACGTRSFVPWGIAAYQNESIFKGAGDVQQALAMLLAAQGRDSFEMMVETAIALLDSADGDVDLEDDDPAGDPLDERGEHPGDSGTDLLPEMPIYGVNQSSGPLNEARAYRRWQTDERARGLSLRGLARLEQRA